MSKVYRVGVIGCGGIANGKHLPSLSRQDKVQVVAFATLLRNGRSRLQNNMETRMLLSIRIIWNY